METPTNYGWFHLLSIVAIIAVTVLFVVKFRNCSDRTFRRIALISWIVMLSFEIYKQFVFSYDVGEQEVTFGYTWYAFPFQLCSTPLYLLPFIAFLKDGKVRDAIISFSSTFALFGGLVVFFYPNDVFIKTVGINIQTMVHHGLQIITGIFFAVHQRKKLSFKWFLSSLPVFVAMILIALILNEAVFAIFSSKQMEDTFNMFYISSHFANHLPLLSLVYASLPYIAFLLLYIIGFAIASLIIYYAIVGGIKLTNKINKGKKC